MRHINKITGLAVGGVLLAGMASNAHAQYSSVVGPVDTTSLLTDIDGNFSVPQFNGPGTLVKVSLQLTGDYDTVVSITNTGTSALNAKAFTEIQAILSPFNVTNSNGSLDTSPVGGQFQAFLDDPSPTFSVHGLASGSSSASPVFSFSDTVTDSVTSAPSLALFTGAGNVNLYYETLTTTTQTLVGTGNAVSSQISHADLIGTVTYYYDINGTPEPGITAFMAAGVLGSMGVIRRRRRRQ